MELTITQHILVQRPEITITINPDTQKTVMEFSHDCSACAGYGSPCRSCTSGRISQVLDPEHLDQIFSGGHLVKIKAALQNLYLTVIGD